MTIEQITTANPLPEAARGTAAHLGPARWKPVSSCWEGTLYAITLERAVRINPDGTVRSVAEQAAALGLRRIEGAADAIWSGAFINEDDQGA